MKRLAPQADKFAAKFPPGRTAVPTWENLRDFIDIHTDGEMPHKALDILTDMTMARINAARSSTEEK